MNRKQLTLLMVVGAVIAGLGWVAWQKQQAAYKDSTRKMGEKVLAKFEPDEVQQLVIKQTKGEVELARENDAWVVRQRGGYPANFGNISDLLRKFWDLKVAKPVSAGPSRLPVLELVPPDKGPGTLVEFRDKAGKTVRSVLLGAKSMKQGGASESPFGGGGGFPDGRYVMVGNDLQSIALVTEPFSNVEPKPEEWLNKDWFKAEKLKSVTVTAPVATNSWKISRDSESGEWKLADAKPGEQLDTAKSGGATSVFSFPSFADVATNTAADVTALEKATVAKVETFEGFTYTARIGAKSGEENHFFQVDVAGSFPKERTAGKEEKAEDKEKLDKEFKEKTSKLEEKLKTEKAFSKWTYVVSKWTVDALLKERKDLLADKKEEAKKDKDKEREDGADLPKVPLK